MSGRTLVLICIGFLCMASQCQKERRDSQSESDITSPKPTEVGDETGEDVEATDAVETPVTPNWESAVEPGIGE